MTRRVLLHVGTPKTATSYLQDALFHNRDLLQREGIHYPAERFDAHFLAALDLMRLSWGGLEEQAVGAWDRLAHRVRAVTDGTVIVSHEILAHASRTEAARARQSLSAGADTELHLVISARDLGRQIPAEWQENVKHRATLTYADFLADLRDPSRSGRRGSWFWRVQELPDIVDRWGAGLPPERIHIVTVPPRGSDPALLWGRFRAAFGLDGIELDMSEVSRDNPSLGTAETTLLRRLNRRVNPVVAPADYRPLVRELLAHETLSRRRHSPGLAIPTELRPWVAELSESWVATLRERGYDVVGDLDDLLGSPDPTPYADPDHPRPRQLARASLDALSALTVEGARLRGEQERLRAELDRARLERDRAIARLDERPVRRVKRRIVLGLQGSRTGRGVLRVYRRVRGRDYR